MRNQNIEQQIHCRTLRSMKIRVDDKVQSESDCSPTSFFFDSFFFGEKLESDKKE